MTNSVTPQVLLYTFIYNCTHKQVKCRCQKQIVMLSCQIGNIDHIINIDKQTTLTSTLLFSYLFLVLVTFVKRPQNNCLVVRRCYLLVCLKVSLNIVLNTVCFGNEITDVARKCITAILYTVASNIDKIKFARMEITY